MYHISFEISAFVLSVFCLLYCIFAKRRQYIPPKGLKNKLTSQHFVFLIMLITNMLSSVSSVTGVLLLNVEAKNIEFWQYLFHALYFIFHSTLSVSFALYIVNVTGGRVHRTKAFYILISIPYLISQVLILTNHWTRWAFYMNPGYNRGLLMPVLYGIGAFYVVLGFVSFFKHKKAISKADSIAVGTFIVIATLGIIVQAVKSSILIELFSESLACLVLMMVLEEKSGHIDPTTGALNRIAFEESNRRLMESREKYSIVVIKLKDLEKFTRKFSGREADELLMMITSWISNQTNLKNVYAYRRECFTVTIEAESNIHEMDFIDTIINRFGHEWVVSGASVRIDVDVYLIKVPDNIYNVEELESLISANYESNKSGSYFVPIYELLDVRKQNSYELAIRRAIEEHHLMVNYQPIWSVKDKISVSAEALLRIDDEELINISPNDYIPIAEKNGLIKDIGLFVFEEVCKILSSEEIKQTKIEYIELNLSTYQFIYGDLLESFEEIRKKYNVPASKINLEITETAATLEGSEVIDILKKFKEIGYTLSLDDFGTGYSNLVRTINSEYLNIKIDKLILWDSLKNGNADVVLSSINGFIKNLHSNIIQEGVETKEQLDLSINAGCDLIQGFYFSQALPKEEFFKYLKKELNNH